MLKLNDFYFITTKEFIDNNTNLNISVGEVLTKDQYDKWNKSHLEYASFLELLYRGFVALIEKDEEFKSLIDNFNYFDFDVDQLIEFYKNFPHEKLIKI